MKSQTLVTVPVAQAVLWHYGDTNLGLESGTFVARLLLAISAADLGNRAKLAAGFPEYVEAMHAVSHEPWGLEWLRNMVKAAA